jgi:signal transduction histidine kinase/CheY-like chemotaxis protein
MSIANTPSSSDFDRLSTQLARFEALFEAVPLAIAVFDDDLRLIRANDRYHDLTSLAPTQSFARPIYDAFPNALADLTEQIDAVVGRTAASATIRVPFRHATGQRVVEMSFQRTDAGFGVGGILFIGADVTEREDLREDLARSVAQLATIFDVIPESVRVFDAAGVITRSNSHAQRDHVENPPRSLTDLWRQDHPRALSGASLFMHEHPTARALRGESVRGQTLAVRRGDGTPAVVEVNSNPLRDGEGRIRGAVSVERDVTERTRLATELEEQVRRSAVLFERVSTEAERLERMVAARTQEVLELQEARARERRLAAVGQLAAGVMHDVNNALNPIMAAAHLLDINADNPDAVRDYAARIARAAETGAATAERVGRFIRQDPLTGERDETVDLAVVANEVVAMTRPLWAERARGGVVRLERADEDSVLARGIVGEVREAMLNLIQNALDAMPGGGTLSITTSVCNGEACIEVRDTGAGMSAEVRDRAFEPFFTTKGTRGTGLGLSEVYGIMKRHRGRVEIDSSPGAGTAVRLAFPLAVELESIVPPVGRVRVTRRILLVEDNVDGREFMLELLVTEGHIVECVSTARDALAYLTNGDVPPYDLLLTDIGLPDGSGWDLVAEVRARWPGLRIGVVTGWEARSGGAATADFVLRKPVRTKELLDQISLGG